MKSLMVVLFLSVATSFYAQVKKGEVDDQSMKPEELPEIVIKAAGKDFSIYIPDKNPDQDVRYLQDKFIAYDLGKDYEGYESYLVTMETEKGSLAATYNENGKLTSVVENYENVKLPSAVIFSIYKKYPGWRIVNDEFLYTQEDGDIIKKQYNLKVKKNKKTRRLIVHPNGEIIKGFD